MVHCSAARVDQCFLMGEVPNAAAPVLQIDVAEPGPRPHEQLDRPAVQAGGRVFAAGGFREQRGLGAFFQHDQCAAQVHAPPARGPKRCAAADRSPPRAAHRAAFRRTRRPPEARQTCPRRRRPPGPNAAAPALRVPAAAGRGCRRARPAGPISGPARFRRRAVDRHVAAGQLDAFAASSAGGSGNPRPAGSGGPNSSRRKPRMSVRIHSSCLRSGRGARS